jgi:hypothetical protein
MKKEDIINAQLLALEAMRIVKSKKLDESFRWLIENKHSIKSSSVAFEDNLPSDEERITITELSETFLIHFKNARSVYTPDENATMGDFCLTYNGTVVCETSWSKRRDDEWSSSYYTLHLKNTEWVKTLKLGDWLNNLGLIIDRLKTEQESFDLQNQEQKEENEAKRIIKSFDLGNFSTDDKD